MTIGAFRELVRERLPAQHGPFTLEAEASGERDHVVTVRHPASGCELSMVVEAAALLDPKRAELVLGMIVSGVRGSFGRRDLPKPRE